MADYYRVREMDYKCKRCSLSTGQAIFGQAEVPLPQVELIIVSAYPGYHEVLNGITLAPNVRPKTRTENTYKSKYKPQHYVYNAGKMLRESITAIFDNDKELPVELKPFINRCFLTNSVKCSPINGRDKKTVTPAHISTCRSWLELEIESISRTNPTVPILLAATEAAKLLGKKEGVYNNRREVWNYNGHPTVVTFNPIEVVRYSRMIYDKELFDVDPTNPKAIRFAKPLIPGEMRWFWQKDLELIKSEVLKNYRSRSKDT